MINYSLSVDKMSLLKKGVIGLLVPIVVNNFIIMLPVSSVLFPLEPFFCESSF